MLQLHNRPKAKSSENKEKMEFIDEVILKLEEDPEISQDLEIFKDRFRGQEDLTLELLYFVFFTGFMNMTENFEDNMEDFVEDTEGDADFHDLKNRLSFLEEDVRKIKRKVKKM